MTLADLWISKLYYSSKYKYVEVGRRGGGGWGKGNGNRKKGRNCGLNGKGETVALFSLIFSFAAEAI